MIRIVVSYPNQPGARFDLDYYLNKHLPMVAGKLAAHGMAGWAADQGVAGPTPAAPAEFMIQAHILFESLEQFQAGMAAEGAAIMADIANYTDIQPHIQVNKVLGERRPS